MAQLPTQPNLLKADWDSTAPTHSGGVPVSDAEVIRYCIIRMSDQVGSLLPQQKNKEMPPSTKMVENLVVKIASEILEIQHNYMTEEDVTDCYKHATEISQILEKYRSISGDEVIIITDFYRQILTPT